MDGSAWKLLGRVAPAGQTHSPVPRAEPGQPCRVGGEENASPAPNNHCTKMKCDFNCNHVCSGLLPLRPDAPKTRPEDSYISDYEEGFCKDCAKEYQKLLHNNELQNRSPRNTDFKSDGKPVHNKENKKVLWRHGANASEMDALETSRFNEDSGYSSLLGSQYSDTTEYEDSILLAGNICNTPKHCLIQNQNQLQFPKKNLQPALHFEELVCSTLKKSGKRNLKSWATVEKMISKGNFGLRNLIGRKMGLDRVDILGELFHRELRHLLANILRHLDEMALINVAKVSTTWKKILQDDKWAFQVYNKANSNAKSSEHAATREYTLYRVALASVQKITTPLNSCRKASRSKTTNQSNQSGSTISRHMEFSEIAKTLKNTESLKVCHCCGSPAVYDSYLQRATCKRVSCGFDFCTKCLCSYHSSKDCLSGPLPGTKKSKQNLRRF
uniref:F-box protein 5 n=1 Tax=Sphenodon punctatus TaxID=8508 RepID=A0A8D0HD59_SPHPU